MANRHKLNVRNFEVPKRTFAIDTRSHSQSMAQAKAARTTIRKPRNPYHEGIEDAKQPRSHAKAWNASPHPNVVAVDRRTRAKEREKLRNDAWYRSMHRKLDPTLT